MKFESTHALFLIGGMVLGSLFFWIIFHIKKSGFEALAKHILNTAQSEAEKKKNLSLLEMKEKEFAHAKHLDTLLEEGRKNIDRREEKLTLREEKLEAKLQLVVKKISEIEKKEELLAAHKENLEKARKETETLNDQIHQELVSISGLSVNVAKESLLKKLEGELQQEMAKLTLKAQSEMQENLDHEIAKLLSTTLNRLALPALSEATVTTVPIPNEEMKGRIIGREGRNIRQLELLTGVNFVMDDTPGTICLSCFDPVRKQIAKSALSELIQGGRIHPTSIEEAVEKAKKTIDRTIKEKGTEAALRAGVFHLHPELTTLLGKLSFRTSFGQNVLEHSVEVSHIMGLMAQELKLDVVLAKRIGLLHDIGKAVSADVPGSHAIVGHDIALKCGESPEVANGIGCHHHEIPPTTIEGSLCSSADAISGGRLGARSEALEHYIKRLGKLEAISSQYPGVEKAYALQAGKEVRVVVVPELINDKETLLLARTLAKRIEEELTYPGKIKVTVIREKKAIEYAS